MTLFTAVHLLIYTDDAQATRAFLRDVLQFPYVTPGPPDGSREGSPSHGDERDWLIFGAGLSELGVHPTVSRHGDQTFTTPRQHQITFMCEDLDDTVATLKSRGASFDDEPTDAGFGRTVMLTVPGADPIMLYEPRHATAYQLSGGPEPTT